mgnify:CR=1 FL=1
MAYLSRRQLEFALEPIGDMTRPNGRGGLVCFGGGKGDSPDPPDYTPMAAASEKAAELGKELGDAQLAEAKRQYEENMRVAAPIVDEQLGLMKQTKAQGDDYYEYNKTRARPVEDAMNAEAMAAGSEAKQQEKADKAEADAMRGLTKSANIIARQGVRYGMSADKLNKAGEEMSAGMASGIAAARGAAREKEEATGFAKKADVAGLYRGLTGASQGSYGLAISAGNSANQNQMAPGQALLGGMAQGAGMQQTGMGQNIQGQSAILNSQTSAYNAGMSASAGEAAGQGQVVGAAIGGIAAAI